MIKDIKALQNERKSLVYDFERVQHVGLSENTTRVMRNVISDRINEIDSLLDKEVEKEASKNCSHIREVCRDLIKASCKTISNEINKLIGGNNAKN